MRMIHSFLAATLYSASIIALLAMTTPPKNPAPGTTAEFGPVTIIAVEAPATVADGDGNQRTREIS
ncbi:MAG: hypothetical protein P8Y29_03450 [Gemmatimonadota bacterium]|jgi:hypothetical protein